MKLVESLEEYYQIVRIAKEKCGYLATNNCLFPNSIERYIQLRRFYAENNDAGIMFYSDEEEYYQAYYYESANYDFKILPKEKPILLQNIYMQGKKKQEIIDIEKKLQKMGFVLKDRMRHAVFEGWDKWDDFRRAAKVSQRIMIKNGFQYMPVSREQLSEVLEFAKTIKEIPYYQIPYYTKNEYGKEAEEKRFCCITDSDGKIVAVRHLIVNGKKAYGWVGVEERYKKTYGMALLFLCEALDYVHEKNIKMCSWVDEKNTVSVQYHEHIGSVWTGHLEEEWLLDKEV